MFDNFYRGKRVLVTGHTGFKGSWLTSWLLELGAEVSGLSLEPDTDPSLFYQLDLEHRCQSYIGDIRDGDNLRFLVERLQPEIVFHLAAQPLVRRSYRDAPETFATNVLGTVNLLEALKSITGRCSAVIVTSDKCYQNQESNHSYSEDDRLGGFDPYSASKACAEIVVDSYRNSFFVQSVGAIYSGRPNVQIASARAGNVVGGGDWSEDRLVPDCIRAIARREQIEIRSPNSTRPWQHVLEPLGGYLLLAQKLDRDPSLSTAFNFGPKSDSHRTVRDLVEELLRHTNGSWRDASSAKDCHEAGLLSVSIDKARRLLGWNPIWSFEETIRRTVCWYAEASTEAPRRSSPVVRALIERDIAEYQERLESWLESSAASGKEHLQCQSSPS